MSSSRIVGEEGNLQLVESGETSSPAMSDDDLQVSKIHDAVVAGDLKRNLASIRKFVGCAQTRAIHLNRLYIDRFGKTRS